MRRAPPIVIAAVVAGLMILSSAPRAFAQASNPSTNSVLVLPFSAASEPSQAWIGKAVQQDLLTDLTQGTTAQVIAPAGISPAADVDEALKAGRDKNASIVVYGQAQTTGKEVRLSGQVIDVATGKPIAALKATGPTDDLFHLEDALAGQVFTALPANLLTATARQGMQAAAQARAQAAQQPAQANSSTWPNGPYTEPGLNSNSIYGTAPAEVQTVQPPAYDGSVYPYDSYDTIPDTGYYSDYPAYSYGYPYWYGWWPGWGLGFYVSPGFGFHHHDGFGRGGFGHNHFGSRFGSGFNTARSGSAFLGSSRFGTSGLRSVAPRSTFGGVRGAVGGGFHPAAGAFRGGGFRGASMGGGFRGGGGFHGGGFSGGGGHR